MSEGLHPASMGVSTRLSVLQRLSPYIPLLIVALAAVVRFWRLDFHSFWFDEAVSLNWATSDVSFIWEKTFPLVEEKHPPAYYTLLHGWLWLLEWFNLHQNDAAIRSLGALLGVVTTWATLRLVTDISRAGSGINSGWLAGMLAGLLVALSPLLVWYSQETRMFQPATTGILLGALGLFAAWHSTHLGQRLLWWLLLIAGFTFALYSYLFSAFVMPAAGLSLLLLYFTHARSRHNVSHNMRAGRRLLEGILALGIVTLLFLPLAQNAWGVNAAESTPGQAFENFWDNHVRLLQVFTLWRANWPAWLIHVALLLWGALLLLGLLPIRRGKHATPNSFVPALDAYWLWLWLGLPLLIANILLSRSGSIFDEDRYLLFLAPFALWAIARGVVQAGRWLPAVGGVLAMLLIAGQLAALPQVWSPANYRENWRAAAQYIIDYTRATPYLSAAVVSHIDYTNLALQWYLRQEFTHEELNVFFPFGGWIDPQRIEEDVAPPLRGIEDLGVDTLWLVQAHLQHVDPERHVEGWLQSTYPIVTELYPAGIQMTGHSLRRQYDTLPVHGNSPAADFTPVEVAPGLHLHHCAPVFAPVSATDTLYHPPSGWVHLQTWWSRDEMTDENYEWAARVIGPHEIWGESLSRRADTFKMHPPSAWTPGAFIRAELDINMNPITPPGHYEIEVRLEKGSEQYTASCGSLEIR